MMISALNEGLPGGASVCTMWRRICVGGKKGCSWLSRESQLHPFFPPTQILRHIVHTDAPPGRPSFSAEIIITSNHAATHVDAFGHYDKGGEPIAEMPIDTL